MNRHFSFIIVFVILITGIQNIGLAQNPKIKFGKISLEELQMQTYPQDTSAGAVVLFNKGYFNSSTFKFTYFTRIKILKPSGLHYADLTFFTPSKSDVSGYTYNLSPTNEIIKEKLKSSSIYPEEIVKNFIILKAAMPNVKVGSVIDISFTYFGFPFQWAFQDYIPTVWSELRIDDSHEISYNKTQYGLENLYISEPNYWVAKDMPAISPEPYMNSVKNYMTKFEFNITEVRLRYSYYNLSNTWDAVSKILDESDRFGAQLRGGYFLKSVADSIKKSSSSDLEKVTKALAHVQRQIPWSGSTTLQTTDELAFKYKKVQMGSSADINLCFILLLRKLGLEAYPVVLSTRDNGFLSPIYPSLVKLNNVITHIKLGEEWLIIDASERNAPLGLLPVRCINLQGRIIDKEHGRWVSLEPNQKYIKNIYSLISVTDSNSIAYQSTISHDGYAGLEQRTNMEQDAYENTRKSMLETAHNVLVSKYETSGIETLDKPLKEQLTMHQSINNTGNYLLINPFVGQHFTKNPLFLEERKFPLDFIYPISETYTATLLLPEGYEVESIPESAAIALPDNAGLFIYKIARSNKTIHLKYSFELNQYLYAPDKYKMVKQFIDMIINTASNPIILKKV